MAVLCRKPSSVPISPKAKVKVLSMAHKLGNKMTYCFNKATRHFGSSTNPTRKEQKLRQCWVPGALWWSGPYLLLQAVSYPLPLLVPPASLFFFTQSQTLLWALALAVLPAWKAVPPALTHPQSSPPSPTHLWSNVPLQKSDLSE